MNLRHYISVVWVAVCLLAVSLAACADQTFSGGGEAGGENGGDTFRIGFDVMLPYMPGSDSRASYESGYGDFENTIDLRNKDFRVLLFNSDDLTLLCSFTPDEVVLIENESQASSTVRSYRLWAEVDKSITKYSKLKLVVLANWQEYPKFTINTTTIDDLAGYAAQAAVSSDASTTFPASLTLTGQQGKHIPMFGVKEVTPQWKNFSLTWLDDVWMLRAVAKIEVKTAEGSPKLTSVILDRYNPMGTCAPKKVYDQPDYVTDDKQYTGNIELTLPGDKNNPESEYILQRNDEGAYVVYVPEYQILKDAAKSTKDLVDDYARLKVKFEGDANTYDVDFKYYTADAAADNDGKVGDYFDIKRNYYYRYTLNLLPGEPEIKVDVLPYRAVVLRPTFGLPLAGLSLSKQVVYLYTNTLEDNVISASSDTIRAINEQGLQINASNITWTFQSLNTEDPSTLDPIVKARDEQIEEHHPDAIKGNNCYLYEDADGNCVVMSRALARGRDVIIASTVDHNGLSLEAELVVEVSGRHLGLDKTFLGLMPEDKNVEGSKGSFTGMIIAETENDKGEGVNLRWRLLNTEADNIDAEDKYESELDYLRQNVVVRVNGAPLATSIPGETGNLRSNEWADIGNANTFTVEVQGGVYTGEAYLWVEVECPARNDQGSRVRYSTYCEILVEEPNISCFPTSANVSVGQSISVAAIISPKFSDYFPEVKYVCSDPSIASVDENGLIHGIRKGSVTIDIYNDTDFNGKISCTMYVNVTNNPLVLVRADDYSEILRQVELKAGESIQLHAYSNGSDVTNEATWTVVDKPSTLNIVESVNDGLIIASNQLKNDGVNIDKGTVSVQVQYEVEGVMQTQKCVVVVAQNRQLIINQHPYAVSQYAQVPFSAYFFPDRRPLSMRNDIFTWTSSDSSIIGFPIIEEPNIAVANKVGKATITAKGTYIDGTNTESNIIGESNIEVIEFNEPDPPAKVNEFKVYVYDASGNLANVTHPDNSTSNEIKSEYINYPLNGDDRRDEFDFIKIKQGETWTIKIVGEPKDVPSLGTTSELIYRFESYHKRRISATVADGGKSISVTALSNTGESDVQVNNRYNELVIRFAYDGKEYTRHIVVYTPYHY